MFVAFLYSLSICVYLFVDYMKYKMDDYWVSSIGRTKDSVLFWKATGEPLAFPYFNGRIIEKQPCLSFRQKELKLQEELSCAHRYMPSMCEKGMSAEK